jgi:cell wall-associated NlpC family hydrolase
MAAQLRLILLMFTVTYALVFGPAGVFAQGVKLHRHKAFRVGPLRAGRFRDKQLAQPAPISVRVVQHARRLIGIPYVYGGSSPRSGFDCSGFVRYVYNSVGINLPHSSYADFNLGRRVSRWALKPGDLVFFNGVGHVGMYVGHGRFIHAPHSGTHVQISSLAGYGTFDGARRIVAGARRTLLRSN